MLLLKGEQSPKEMAVSLLIFVTFFFFSLTLMYQNELKPLVSHKGEPGCVLQGSFSL